MQQVGAFEAKTHFSHLLEQVMAGEQVVITKHGERVARLVPYLPIEQQEDFSAVIAAMQKLRKKVGGGQVCLRDIQAMKEEGRAS